MEAVPSVSGSDLRIQRAVVRMLESPHGSEEPDVIVNSFGPDDDGLQAWLVRELVDLNAGRG